VRRGHVPVRTCIGCLTRRPKHELVRLVSAERGLGIGNLDGRGFYLCRDVACLDRARKGKKMKRALGRHLTDREDAALRRVVSCQNGLDGACSKAVICSSSTGGDPVA
jgi:predicted RNA-binding protein YlxR (DUF448 family)